MPFCKYCGRSLQDGEVCNCRSGPLTVDPYGTEDSYGNGPSADNSYGNGSQGYEVMRQPGYGNGQYSRRNTGTGPDGSRRSGASFNNDRNSERFRQAANRAMDAGRKSAETFQNSMTEGNVSKGGAYERNMPIVDKCIVPMEGEIPIRQYNFAVLRTIFPYKRAEGRLQVTNRRLIFRATGKSNLGRIFYENEFMLHNISGIEISKGKRTNGLFLLLGILYMLIGCGIGSIIGSMTIDSYYDPGLLGPVLGILILAGGIAVSVTMKGQRHWLKILLFSPALAIFYMASQYDTNIWTFFMVVSAILTIAYIIFFSIKDDLILRIRVADGLGVVDIRRKKSVFGFEREGFTGFEEVLPWKDTDAAIRELGALIQDVKTGGNAAVSKWKQP
ncbi:MAG: hypothetical protein LUF78_13580 [Clostridiales bacterium]|nr:hypothetical protein [Clostridiales bacterium]